MIAYLKVNNPVQEISFENSAIEKIIYPTKQNHTLISPFGIYLRLLEIVYLKHHVYISSNTSENKFKM